MYFQLSQQWGLLINQDAGLTEHLSDWRIDRNQRRIIVQAVETIERIDLHGNY